MTDTRRTFTPEQKAEVVAFVKANSLKAAMEKFSIVESVIRRWISKAAPAQRGGYRPRRWTAAKIARVLEYTKTHSYTRTLARFHISSAQLHAWRHGQQSLPRKRHNGGNGAFPERADPVLELPVKEALVWLERWRSAYFDRMKAETPTAAAVLAALRGEK